jgi:hypothetical protein
LFSDLQYCPIEVTIIKPERKKLQYKKKTFKPNSMIGLYITTAKTMYTFISHYQNAEQVHNINVANKYSKEFSTVQIIKSFKDAIRKKIQDQEMNDETEGVTTMSIKSKTFCVMRFQVTKLLLGKVTSVCHYIHVFHVLQHKNLFHE